MSDDVRFAVPDTTSAETEATARVLNSGWITTGIECQLLESELADYLGIEHVVAVSSCTAALEIAVAHLQLRPGARIGVPTWTFASTALAAIHRGHRPVFLDVDPDTCNLSPRSLELALATGIDAVVGVHFGGVPLDRQIYDQCEAAGVPLIEDAAHALGAADHRGRVAGRGTAGCCYSFYATKNLTCGEGGALATDDPDLADFARSFRLHGMDRDAWARYHPDSEGAGQYDLMGDGLKANLPDILAAMARVQLQRFDALQTRRIEIVQSYRQLLEAVPTIRAVPTVYRAEGANHLMVVELPAGVSRLTVQRELAGRGIGTSVHFQPLHTFAWFRRNGYGVGPGGTPEANKLAPRLLSLPLHTKLSNADVERVATGLLEAIDIAGVHAEPPGF